MYGCAWQLLIKKSDDDDDNDDDDGDDDVDDDDDDKKESTHKLQDIKNKILVIEVTYIFIHRLSIINITVNMSGHYRPAIYYVC